MSNLVGSLSPFTSLLVPQRVRNRACFASAIDLDCAELEVGAEKKLLDDGKSLSQRLPAFLAILFGFVVFMLVEKCPDGIEMHPGR